MEYRLIETEYGNRIVYEDGPGSLMHVVADERRSILMRGNIGDHASKEEMVSRAQPFIPYPGQDYGLGLYEYSYILESRKSEADEWKFVASLQYVPPGDDTWEYDFEG